MKQPKYCHYCGNELIYWEQPFKKGVEYDIYTGEPKPYEEMYRSWRCPLRSGAVVNYSHDLYRVIGDQKFKWEEEQELVEAWETYKGKGQPDWEFVFKDAM